ncbi:MAG: glycosyltransferase family 2 protein [Methylococcales bacterium]|nr:glycosyltransferase family 2 protein [Methylococcales bacterium]
MRNFLQAINCAINDENLIEAKKLLSLGVASGVKKSEWKIYQFIIALKSNQLELAVICLQEVLKHSNAPSDLYLQFGVLHIKKNNFTSALAVFHKGLLKFPLSVTLLSKYVECGHYLRLTNSKILQQRAGLLLSLIEFDALKTLTFCYEILLKTSTEIGALWIKKDKIYGWVIDPKSQQQSLFLLGISYLNTIKFMANQATPELKKIGIGNGFNGFCLSLKDHNQQLDVVTVGHRKRLFGSPLLTYSDDEKLGNPYDLNLKIAQKKDGLIDIIIPIFGGFESLKYCLQALEKNENFKTKYHLVLVNDCSASSKIKGYLQQLKKSPQITVIDNSHNVGFIASVNIGMQQHPWRDVILLNSDTVVVNNSLDRLKQLAYSDKKIATITPLSNYAEKFSYPIPFKTNDLPTIKQIQKIDGIAAKINKNHGIEVPTGNGFCFFIKRECLNEIGYFNQTDLLRGYSEESEFCLRATEKGWKHLCATNVYIGHEGGQSFKQERARLAYLNNELIKTKYPLYSEQIRQFIVNDPLKNARKRIESVLLKQKKCDILYVVDYFLNEHPLFKEVLKQAVLSGKEAWVLSLSYKNTHTALQLFEASYGESNLEYNCLTQVSSLVEDIKKIKPLRIEAHHSRYFPAILNQVLAQLSHSMTACPYDDYLEKEWDNILWAKRINNIILLSEGATMHYKHHSNTKKWLLPEYFYKKQTNKRYSAYIAILGNINAEHQQLLKKIADYWLEYPIDLTFMVVGDSSFKSSLESNQKIIFTSLTIDECPELKQLCSHVFVLPNNIGFMPTDLVLALQYNFDLIAFSQPNTQEILALQPSAIVMNVSDNPLEILHKTFQSYAKKVS